MTPRVEIYDTTGIERRGWRLPAGVTFRRSTVQLEEVRIADSRADAALAAVDAELDASGLALERSAGTGMLLTVYANVVGMLGGSVVTGLLSDVSLLQYYVQTSSSVTLGDWAGGLFKAIVYGIIIAIAGCLRSSAHRQYWWY